jgi:hypothetical protein
VLQRPSWATVNCAPPPCHTTEIAPVRLAALVLASTEYVNVIHGVDVEALHEQPLVVLRVTVNAKAPPDAPTLCAGGDSVNTHSVAPSCVIATDPLEFAALTMIVPVRVTSWFCGTV